MIHRSSVTVFPSFDSLPFVWWKKAHYYFEADGTNCTAGHDEYTPEDERIVNVPHS